MNRANRTWLATNLWQDSRVHHFQYGASKTLYTASRQFESDIPFANVQVLDEQFPLGYGSCGPKQGNKPDNQLREHRSRATGRRCLRSPCLPIL